MKSTITKLLILGLILSPALCLAQESFPSFPMAFWGNAEIDNELLSTGTMIKAYCDSNMIGEVIMMENGIYGYAEATKSKLLISSCNGDILFKYLLLGEEQEQTGIDEIRYTEGFVSGTTVNKDLNFITLTDDDNDDDDDDADDTPDPPNNGGGGGGGGGSYNPPPTTPLIPTTTTKGDMNEDNKVNKYDFSLLMSNWSK